MFLVVSSSKWLGLYMGNFFLPRSLKTSTRSNFFKKVYQTGSSSLYFNNIPVNQTSTQKHIGLYLDKKVNYNTHIKKKLRKVYKSIRLLIRNFSNKILRQALVRQKTTPLTMVIFCMISQIMEHLLIKLRKYNMMQHSGPFKRCMLLQQPE